MNKIFAINIEQKNENIRFSEDKTLINNYVSDESGIILGSAERVYFPTNEYQIIQIIKECNKIKKRLTISGGGTGITGSRVPLGGVIIAMDDFTEIHRKPKSNEKILKKEYLGKTYSIIVGYDENKGEYYAIAPPGIPLKVLYKMVEEEGLFYPPDPTEQNAFLSGTVATNASGARTFHFGTTRDYIRRIRIVLPTGEVINVEREKYKVIDWKFYIIYPNGKEVKFELPHYNLPKLKKNSAGYYIKKDMDLIDLFIGSEGTLGVFTEIEIKLLRKPKIIYPFYSMFLTEFDAINFAKKLRSIAYEIEDKIISIEFFDENSVNITKKIYPEIITKEAKAIIFFEIMSNDEEKLTKNLSKINEIIEKFNPITSLLLDVNKAKEIRHSIPKSVNEFVRKQGLHKVATDIAVPEESFSEMYNYYHKIGKESNMLYVIFGHIGDFHLHFNFLPKNKEELKKALEYCTLLLKKAIELGGTPTAEHGIGKKKYVENGKEKPMVDLIYDKETIRQLISIKKSIDPNLILNIGNIIPEEYYLKFIS